jgi:hypothetical protein
MSWTDEIWKITYLNGNQIMVSSFGRIMGFSGRILKPQITGNGYLAIKYWNGEYISSKLIHRIVAETFMPNPNNKPEVDHIDTNKLNNRICNLRWVTKSENQNNPLTLKHKSEAIKGRPLPKEQVMKMRETNPFKMEVICIETNIIYESASEAARQTGIPQGNISRACRKGGNMAGGFRWKYVKSN